MKQEKIKEKETKIKTKKITSFKILLVILIIALLTIGTIYLFPVMKQLTTMEGKLAFKEMIDEAGMIGILILFGLQLAQIFLVILPGEPIEILAGICYGSFWGTIIIMISAFIISTSIYLLVRKYGRKLVLNFFEEEKVKKIEKSKIFKNPKKIEYIMLVLFLLPGTPKDLLVYVAGLLPIKPQSFILISTFARFPSVISSTLAGENILEGNLKMGVLLYLAIIILIITIIFIINKFDKNKTAEKALKSIN